MLILSKTPHCLKQGFEGTVYLSINLAFFFLAPLENYVFLSINPQYFSSEMFLFKTRKKKEGHVFAKTHHVHINFEHCRSKFGVGKISFMLSEAAFI